MVYVESTANPSCGKGVKGLSRSWGYPQTCLSLLRTLGVPLPYPRPWTPISPWGHQPQWCFSRAGLQLPTALPSGGPTGGPSHPSSSGWRWEVNVSEHLKGRGWHRTLGRQEHRQTPSRQAMQVRSLLLWCTIALCCFHTFQPSTAWPRNKRILLFSS